MKRSWMLIVEALVVAAALLVIGMGSVRFVSSRLEAEALLQQKRLAAALRPLLERAYVEKDDLALQRLVAGVGAAPGIGLAAVADAEAKTIAHSDLRRIGKTLDAPPKAGHRRYELSLEYQKRPWGTLWIDVSTRSWQNAIAAWKRRVFGVLLLLLLFWTARLGLIALQQQRQRAAEQEWSELLAERDARLAQCQRQAADRQRAQAELLRATLELSARPMAAFDAAQRLVGWNSSARQQLHVRAKESFEGASWQDLPYISGEGSALARALEQPGTRVPFQNPVHNRLWHFLAESTPAGLLLWAIGEEAPDRAAEPAG